ncbi:MAG TPA: ferritin family protein [Bryobacteraceae bacterium]|jgi:rubrerythrin|nr:ferritin family protein [Bryobacteraceae bacterium]
MAKSFRDLTEREILALAISLEEEDGRIYGEFAQKLRTDYPSTAKMLGEMQAEEAGHRNSLIELFRSRFGDHIPMIRRSDVKGFVSRPPVWLLPNIGPNAVRRAVESMESETRRFYHLAADKTTDASTRQLLGQLAAAEEKHSEAAEAFEKREITQGVRKSESEAQRRAFVLQFVQPGLAGLMDGSVSTLAPLFAAAFATKTSHDAFVVGLAASIGAGISMAFAEALSDTGELTGRGSPVVRGIVTGMMTTAGGIGHTLPFLISDFHVATYFAFGVVIIELGVISWIRQHYMDTPLVRAALQVVLGGVLVFVAGILIGKS